MLYFVDAVAFARILVPDAGALPDVRLLSWYEGAVKACYLATKNPWSYEAWLHASLATLPSTIGGRIMPCVVAVSLDQ